MDSDALALCDEAIGTAERHPNRHDEYTGSILIVLAEIRGRVVKNGKLSPRDERNLSEIIMLTEKWVD